jgi:Flp pilus assembly pilin Flp
MGAAKGLVLAADAAGGRSAHSPLARFDLSALLLGLFRQERASTAIEYAMIAGGIALVIVSAVNTLGQNVNSMFFAKIAAVI